MSIISTEKIGFLGENFIKKIEYSSKNKLFSIKLPDWIADKIGKISVLAETEDKVQHLFNKACEEYKIRLTKSRKVIAYTVQINANIMEEIDNICILSRHDISFLHADCAFGFDYRILIESIFEDRPTYRNEKDCRFDLRDWIVIEWTEQRENFFKKTKKELEALTIRVDGFFKDSKKFLERVDNNQPLLENKE